MKHAALFILALLIVVSANAGEMKRRYMMSSGVDSSMSFNLGGKEVFKVPQMILVVFYDNGCDSCSSKHDPIMIVNDVVSTGYVSEFDSIAESECNAFNKMNIYGNVESNTYCLVYHRDIPMTAFDFGNFRATAIDSMNTVLECTETNKCSMYFKK